MTDKNNAMPMEFSKLGNELSKKFELGFSAEILNWAMNFLKNLN